MNLYAARLLVVCLVDDGKPKKRNTCDYQFMVFRAKEYKDALRRALALGKQQETIYRNVKGQKVRWAFVGVEQVTRLGKKLDGREIGSLLDVLSTQRPIPYRKKFNPKSYKTYFS